MDLRDQLTVYEQMGWINMRAITFSFLDQSSSRGLEKFVENMPTILEVIGAHTLNFKPHFKFSLSKVFWGPLPHLGVHYQGLVNRCADICLLEKCSPDKCSQDNCSLVKCSLH